MRNKNAGPQLKRIVGASTGTTTGNTEITTNATETADTEGRIFS